MSDRAKTAKTYSLRGQLITLIVALAIPLVALQGWWSYHGYRDARAHAETAALAFADAASLGVMQFFRQSEELMMAAMSDFGPEWIVSGRCDVGVARMVDLLPFLVNALAVDREGRVVCSATLGPPDATASEWPWFPDMREEPRFTIGDPARGDFTDSWIIPLVAPFIDSEGAFAGAIVGTVSLLELSDLFGGVILPEDYLITVATADRVVVARSHAAEEWIGRSLPDNTGSDRVVGPGRTVATGPDLAGVDRTWGQVATDAGWVIYAGVPEAVIYAPALADVKRNAVLTLALILLGIAFAGRSYRRIARALHELAEKTRTVRSGDIVPLPLGTPSEVTEVVEQFNETLRERDRAQAAEHAALERYESLFDNAVFGLYISSADDRFLQVNPALASMLGYESVDALMEAGPRGLYANPRVREEHLRESLASGIVPLHEIQWLRSDGVPITVRTGGKVITSAQGERVFEMIVQDITDEKRIEDELRQTQKMEAIGQLAGGIAHDFNNLLTVIGGNVELLDDELEEGNDLREDLDQIAKATRRAASVTKRLLAFSRKQPRGERCLDVNEVIADLKQMLVPLIGENVTLVTEGTPEPLPISIDPGELEQIVLNLVLNSRDAMPEGGSIVIQTRAARAQAGEPDPKLDPGAAGDGVILSVEDTGAGMDADTQERIFEPFFTTKPMEAGTGLGLSTVYGIVKRAGGRIDVTSALGSGTTIEIWFPLAELGPLQGPVRAPIVEGARGTETVLVVEDDDLVRRFVRRALEDSGFTVLVAVDGQDAIERIESASEPVDLVLTDVVMPRVTGPELADRVALVAPGTPVLFMSGYMNEPFLATDKRLHSGDLLQKPFSAAELRSRVRLALDGQRATSTETS